MIDVVQFNQRGSQQVADFGGGVELIWTPAVDPKDTLGIPALQGAPQAPKIWIYPPTPMADSIIVDPIYPPDYKDFILVFPADSGVPPLYIVFSLRDKPGVVTGSGQDATGIWLSSANNDLGSPIPSRIADQLRGKRFNSFDDFRKAFWITVGNDAELKAQFNNSNKARMLECSTALRPEPLMSIPWVSAALSSFIISTQSPKVARSMMLTIYVL